MITFLAIMFLGSGLYATLVGFGHIHKSSRWCMREEAQWAGRFGLFFGGLFLLDACGITPHQISSWIEDILTSGGGIGTG